MSDISVSISMRRAVNDFAVSEAGNYTGDDLPIADTTEIYIDLGDGVYVATTIGQARELAKAIERGIAEIPDDRVKRREREKRAQEFRERRAAAKAVSA